MDDVTIDNTPMNKLSFIVVFIISPVKKSNIKTRLGTKKMTLFHFQVTQDVRKAKYTGMIAESLFAFISFFSPISKPTFPAHAFHLQLDSVQFAEALPLPQRILIHSRGSKPVDLNLTMTQFNMKFHPDLPEQTVWGYDGHLPGPMIEVERDQLVRVHWQNQLPTKHIFPAPTQGLELMYKLGLCLPTTPDVRTVTHLHGAEVTDENPLDRLHNNDGWPDSWITPGAEQIAEYPNHQSARMLWYHDHAMGTTGRNVAAGLFGTYLIRDSYERSLNLPSGKYEIPLVLQSHAFSDDGKLIYTDNINLEHYGNSVSVNGKLWPYLEVEPRKYRFRIVNASNARTYGVVLLDQEKTTAGPAFYQIGTDSGFLENTVVLNDPSDFKSSRLNLAPGERADVIIDFSKFAGRSLIMNNNSRDAGDGEISLPDLMLFKVGTTLSARDVSALPMKMKKIERMQPVDASAVRRVVFDQTTVDGTSMLTLNGKHWNDPIEEKPKLGATEVWELVDNLPDVHPFHIHLVQFQILDRTAFDKNEFSRSGHLILTGNSNQPDPNEMGWKDTVKIYPGTITRIIMKFLPYAGFYIYHCHILEHEDMDMMRPFQIVQ